MDAGKLKSVPPLTAFRISNGAMSGDALPNRIKVLNWGRNETTKGPVLVDEVSVAALAANQVRLGFDKIALDYEHNTLPGTEEYKRTKEPREVAAFGVPEIVPNDGLYLTGLTYTPSGQTSSRNFVDLSPAIHQDAEGRLDFIHSVALTKNGSVFDLSYYSAATANQPANDMPEEQKKTDATPLPTADVISVKEFSAALGLAGAATKEDVLATLKGLSALPAQVKSLTDADAADKTAREARERDTLVAQAAQEGKVIPLSADVLKLTPLSVVADLVKNLPKGMVPLNATGQAAGEKQATLEEQWNAQLARR